MVAQWAIRGFHNLLLHTSGVLRKILREEIIVLLGLKFRVGDDDFNCLPKVIHVLVLDPIDLILSQHHGVLDLSSVIHWLENGHLVDFEWLAHDFGRTILLPLYDLYWFFRAESFHVVWQLLLLTVALFDPHDGIGGVIILLATSERSHVLASVGFDDATIKAFVLGSVSLHRCGRVLSQVVCALTIVIASSHIGLR